MSLVELEVRKIKWFGKLARVGCSLWGPSTSVENGGWIDFPLKDNIGFLCSYQSEFSCLGSDLGPNPNYGPT